MIMAIIMFITTADFTAFAEENIAADTEIINEVSTEEYEKETNEITWDQVTTEDIFEGEDFKVTYTLTSYWDTGYNANIKIENYNLSHMSYPLEDEITVTVNISENMFEYPEVQGYLVANKLEVLNGEVSLSDSKIDKVEFEVVAGKSKVPQNSVSALNGIWTVEEPQLFIGDNIVTITVYSIDGGKAQQSIHIWNTSFDNMNLLDLDMGDIDQDGLQNYQEEQYGTNPNRSDTDEDGFSDIDELFLLDTDPLIFNQDEDFDLDGLLNKEELEINTNIYSQDTDYDGLSDYDEVKIYGTDPKTSDTDRDEINDATEIRVGTNPCVAEKMSPLGMLELEYTTSIEMKDVEMKINISLLPEQVKSFEVTEINEDDAILSSDIPGYLGTGSAYDFTVEGDFSNAILTYYLSDELLELENFEPAIYYYNEETQLLEEMENAVWIENSISVELEHFSRYILLNKREFNRVWGYDIYFNDIGVNDTCLDIVFAYDLPQDIEYNENIDNSKTVTETIVEKLTGNDRISMAFYRGYTSKVAMSMGKENVYLHLDEVDESNAKNLETAISAALIRFMNDDYGVREDSYKCIVLLTDGCGMYDTSQTTIAQNKNVSIYTVGLEGCVSEDVLKEMSEKTGGVYVPISKVDELYNIFDNKVGNGELSRDSDKDGISDYHEKAIASGKLRLGTGVSLTEIDYLDDDSDNDGILDGNEIMVSQSGKMVYIKMFSNPTKKDTDNDGIEDGIERKVINTNIGNHYLSPLKEDTDGDGLLDGDELGKYYDNLGYYRVNSNPFMKEDFVLGGTKPVSFVWAKEIELPWLTRKIYEAGIMPDGRKYEIYTFLDTSTILFTQRKLVLVYGENYETEYYVLFAKTGDTVRGGQGDEIYRKAGCNLYRNQLTVDSGLLDVAFNALKAGETKKDTNPEEFLYYDCGKGRFLTTEEWKQVHFEERFDLNCCFDEYLPITSYEAANMGFEKLSKKDSVYHIPEGIDTEMEKGATHKYITTDGIEAIYELLKDADSVESITNDFQGTKVLPLQQYPEIGPTFNYAPNDNNKTSDSSIAHYYFDMLPYYWWGNVR